MSTLLPVVNVTDLPSPYDEPVIAVGTVTAVEVAPSKDGTYQRVHLTAVYNSPSGAERTAHLRFNLKPEWLTPGFGNLVKTGAVDDKEAIQYRINVAGLWRSLFRAADLTQTDLNLLVGKQIGFKLDYRRDKTGAPQPDNQGEIRAELRSFFEPAYLSKALEAFEKLTAKTRQAEPVAAAI